MWAIQLAKKSVLPCNSKDFSRCNKISNGKICYSSLKIKLHINSHTNCKNFIWNKWQWQKYKTQNILKGIFTFIPHYFITDKHDRLIKENRHNAVKRKANYFSWTSQKNLKLKEC